MVKFDRRWRHGALLWRSGESVRRFCGLINEGTDQAIVSIRLKIDEREVSEAEWVIARAGESLVNFESVVAKSTDQANTSQE